nr:immunoglobulin heavy chain junction region [Macaca mulatta]MOV47782.1 immunoglobulin heavy chain junction region [Macaca mulatta]MOV47925.1 immunoglobulin heavy chain junction region [Macaca mulatta]MOV48132.1 immunoglobulin heavy chain junction region [Macaca mulatta]MOV48224.1 immunoglobulin heavy chain junction region [Macaca mulatta]
CARENLHLYTGSWRFDVW